MQIFRPVIMRFISSLISLFPANVLYNYRKLLNPFFCCYTKKQRQHREPRKSLSPHHEVISVAKLLRVPSFIGTTLLTAHAVRTCVHPCARSCNSRKEVCNKLIISKKTHTRRKSNFQDNRSRSKSSELMRARLTQLMIVRSSILCRKYCSCRRIRMFKFNI